MKTEPKVRKLASLNDLKIDQLADGRVQLRRRNLRERILSEGSVMALLFTPLLFLDDGLAFYLTALGVFVVLMLVIGATRKASVCVEFQGSTVRADGEVFEQVPAIWYSEGFHPETERYELKIGILTSAEEPVPLLQFYGVTWSKHKKIHQIAAKTGLPLQVLEG